MEIPKDVLAARAYDLLAHTATGDLVRAGDVLGEIKAYGDPAALWGVCCATAEAGRGVLTQMFNVAEESVIWRCPGIADAFADDPHRLFAGRFLTAYANGDADMCRALYRAAETAGEDDLTDSVCALVAHVARLFRRAALALETP